MRRIHVFDFDGTIVKINSFPWYVMFLIVDSLFSCNFRRFSSLVYATFLRKLSRITHDDFKFIIVDLRLSELSQKIFTFFLNLYVNEKVMSYLRRLLSTDDFVVISSAAPEVVVHSFFKKIRGMGRLEIIGASVRDGGSFSNFGSFKVSNVVAQFGGYDFEIISVFTDSFDDIDLACIAEHVYVVKPSIKNEELFRNSLPESSMTFLI